MPVLLINTSNVLENERPFSYLPLQSTLSAFGGSDCAYRCMLHDALLCSDYDAKLWEEIASPFALKKPFLEIFKRY
jgi:hypothetical protein